MKVLHLYPTHEPLIAAHVAMLTAAGQDGFTHLTQANDLGAQQPDIVHVHGCWNYSIARNAMRIHRQGCRVVLSPHGGLAPWTLSERRLTEKLSKTIIWQRRIIESAYVTIAHSPIEAEHLEQLGWNPRVETIRDAAVTQSITPEAMCAQTHNVYRKVMDSNTLALMDHTTRHALTCLLKAAICSDRRWVEPIKPQLNRLDDNSWRMLFIYAEHENVRDLVDRGLNILGFTLPFYLDTKKVKSYLPTTYHRPQHTSRSAEDLVRQMTREQPTLLALIELERQLRRDTTDDNLLTANLERDHLLKPFQRLLQLLREQTAIEDGFLPAQPIDDKQTAQLRTLLNNPLRI